MIVPHRPNSRAAFTLTELMISIALVLLLIVGINVVFQATSDTLSAGQKIAEANRNEQALHTVLAEDMRSLILPDEAPFLFIRSMRAGGFANANEMQQDTDYDGSDATILTYDHDADPSTAEASPGPAIYNQRNHRLDAIGFFARGMFRRQTGFSALVDDVVTSEAYIWYGHLKQPNYTYTTADATPPLYNSYYLPGEGTPTDNPENFFVEDWTLGRVAVLLARPEDVNNDTIPDTIYDRNQNPLVDGFLLRGPAEIDFKSGAPLTVNSQDRTGQWAIQWSRYDAAATTIETYRRILAHWVDNQDLIPPVDAGRNEPWFTAVSDFRHLYAPVQPRPLDADRAALAVPGMSRGTSQFIVEFAGDFLSQDNTGAVVAPRPDGVIDFVILANLGQPNEERQIRWYGMPRDSDNNGEILAGANGLDPNMLVDVVPVADLLETAGIPVTSLPINWFERELPGRTGSAYAGTGGTMNPNAQYIAAWGPDTLEYAKPWMIRILIGTVATSDNAQDRIAEFVFRLK